MKQLSRKHWQSFRSLITVKCYSISCLSLTWENGAHIGDAVMGDDGYYLFSPDNNGQWPEDCLFALAVTLHELNEKWDEEVKQGLGHFLAEM